MNNPLILRVLKRTTQNILLLFLCCCVSGCLILMVTGPSNLENTQSNYQKKSSTNSTYPQHSGVHGAVYTLRGLFDIFSTGMNSLATKIHKQLGLTATPMSYLEAKRLSAHLIKSYQSGQLQRPIILIGHSYGADMLITVAEDLNETHIPVDLIIAIDNTKNQIIPENVRTYYNINSGPSILHGLIPWGRALKGASKKTKIVNIDLMRDKGIFYVNHFNIDKLPAVQAYIIEIIKSVRLEKT